MTINKINVNNITNSINGQKIHYSEEITLNTIQHYIIQDLPFKKDDQIVIILSGSFKTNWFLLCADNNLNYRLISITNYDAEENDYWYSITLEEDVSSLYFWCWTLVTPGTFNIDIIYQGLYFESYQNDYLLRLKIKESSIENIHIDALDSSLQNTITISQKYIDLTYSNKTGLCIGDSNMLAVGVATGLGGDPATIMGNIMNAKVMNGAIGGTSFANGGLSFNKIADALKTRDFSEIDSGINSIVLTYGWTFLQDWYTEIKSTPISNIKFILIAYGTNDWKAGRTIDNVNNKFDIDTILGSLRYGVKTLFEANPYLLLYVVTPAYRWGFNVGSEDETSDNTPINGKYLHEIGDAIYDCCLKELHIPCLNYYYVSQSNRYNQSAILNGGTHRTTYGYQLMALHYTKFILSN